MVELAGKIFAYRLEFFMHKFEIFDGLVVIVSFVLDIVFISHEDVSDGMGLLILLRLWRVARIVNGEKLIGIHLRTQLCSINTFRMYENVVTVRTKLLSMDCDHWNIFTILKKNILRYFTNNTISKA